MARDARSRIVESAYDCIARCGLAKTTVEDAARMAGVSRATVYRYFPGGRDELLRAAVAWETQRFMERLALEVAGGGDLAELLARALMAIRRMLDEHQVLQKVLRSEPERLLPYLTLEGARVREMIMAFVSPYLAGEKLPAGLAIQEAADYLARMLLSITLSPGRWDLADEEQLEELVRTELLGGIVAATGR